MNQTKVIDIHKENLKKLGYNSLEEWLLDPNHVYIGRHLVYVKGTFNSKWRNPYPVKRLGREECLKAYRQMITSSPKMLAELEELRGKILGCWCKPEACHGDIIKELLDTI